MRHNRLSYRERLALPGWLILDENERVIASCCAKDAAEAREMFYTAAKRERGTDYFTRVLRDARWIRRAP